MFCPFFVRTLLRSIIKTISYTSLHFNRTYSPLTYHISVSSLELYLHNIIFSVSLHLFVPRNYLIYRSYNIGAAAHRLLIKSLGSEFLDCLIKVIFTLWFLQFCLIVILVWNLNKSQIHTIWVWNYKT